MIDAQYLKEMRNMTRNVKGEAVKLRQMKEELFCIGSVGFGQHIQRTKSSDPMGNRIAAYVDFENEYHKYVNEYIEKYKTMNEAIRDLDIMNQMFIINYCFFGMDCQTAHCGRCKPHNDFGELTSPIVPYRNLPQTPDGMTADCRSIV